MARKRETDPHMIFQQEQNRRQSKLEWRKRNPDKIKQYNSNYSAKKKGFAMNDLHWMAEQFRLHNGKCRLPDCSSPAEVIDRDPITNFRRSLVCRKCYKLLHGIHKDILWEGHPRQNVLRLYINYYYLVQNSTEEISDWLAEWDSGHE